MKVFGHGDDATINTLESFERVRATGAHGVELDVRRTSDDRLAVVHDPIGDRPYAELPRRVPLLEQALDACRGLTVNIEIKNFPKDPAFDPTQRVTDLVLELLDGRDDDVIISCFDRACLEHIADRYPTALLLLSRRPAAELPAWPIIHPYDTMVHDAFMEMARARDLTVNVWTGEDESPQRFRELFDLGVDGVITAAPDTAVAAIR